MAVCLFGFCGLSAGTGVVASTHAAGRCLLSVHTPYSARHPLRLNLVLDPQARAYVGFVRFTLITVTDARPANKPWTLKARAQRLRSTDVGKIGTARQAGKSAISSENVGLVGLGVLGHTPGFDASRANLTLYDHPAASPPVSPTDTGSRGLGGPLMHAIAHAVHGRGAVALRATLQIAAPTSTRPGQFAGSVTFAVGCGRAVVPVKPPPRHHHHHHHHHHHNPSPSPSAAPTSSAVGQPSPGGTHPASGGAGSGGSNTGGSHGTLPFTGLEVAALATAAAIAITTGSLFVLAARGRRRQRGERL
jgi:hypothetical protein